MRKKHSKYKSTTLLTLVLTTSSCALLNKPNTAKSPFSTAFRTWEDGTGKGKIDGKIHLDELVGKNNSFHLPNEKVIRFATRILGKKEYNIYFELYNQNNKLILEKKSKIPSNDYIKYFGVESDKISNNILEKEIYTIVWKVSPKENSNKKHEIDKYKVTFTN